MSSNLGHQKITTPHLEIIKGACVTLSFVYYYHYEFTIMIPSRYPSFSRLDRSMPRVMRPRAAHPCPCLARARASHRAHDPSVYRPWVTLSSAPTSNSTSTSLHWRAASKWAYMLQLYVSCVSNVCWIYFYLDVSKVDLLLHVLQRLYTYVANIYFSCFRHML